MQQLPPHGAAWMLVSQTLLFPSCHWQVLLVMESLDALQDQLVQHMKMHETQAEGVDVWCVQAHVGREQAPWTGLLQPRYPCSDSAAVIPSCAAATTTCDMSLTEPRTPALLLCSKDRRSQDVAKHSAEVWRLLTPPGTDVAQEIAKSKADPAYQPPIREVYQGMAGRAFIVRSRITSPDPERADAAAPAPDLIRELLFISDIMHLCLPPATKWEVKPAQRELLKVSQRAERRSCGKPHSLTSADTAIWTVNCTSATSQQHPRLDLQCTNSYRCSPCWLPLACCLFLSSALHPLLV